MPPTVPAIAGFVGSLAGPQRWFAAPGNFLELLALRWLVELLGMSPETGGTLTSGGAVANLVCLAAGAPACRRAAGLRSQQRGRAPHARAARLLHRLDPRRRHPRPGHPRPGRQRHAPDPDGRRPHAGAGRARAHARRGHRGRLHAGGGHRHRRRRAHRRDRPDRRHARDRARARGVAARRRSVRRLRRARPAGARALRRPDPDRLAGGRPAQVAGRADGLRRGAGARCRAAAAGASHRPARLPQVRRRRRGRSRARPSKSSARARPTARSTSRRPRAG